MSEYQEIWEELKFHFDQFNKAMKNSLSAIKLGEAYKDFKEIATEGAKLGWTIPPHSTINECREMILGKNKIQINKEFEAYYLRQKNYNEMKSELLGDAMMAKWKLLLEECFKNFEEGRYRITIPSLFAILEGVIFDIVKDQKWKEAFKNINVQVNFGSIQMPVFISVHIFVDKAFSFGHLDKPTYKPSLINRNWVLHGRDDINEWQVVDSLRLFNALYSLTFLDLIC